MEKLNTSTSFYSIVIEACEEGGYFAYCPILQGCHAEGKTYGEVIDHIRDVIKVHLALRKKHKELISFIKVKNRSDINIQIPVPVGN
ncbi:MAG: type II toxin-antitoxin system HicB family antitoxin [Patescibacteria group bacterium]